MDTSKVIKGAVSSGRYTVTAPIIKEDYGLYLQIEGVELPQTYEVDFSNSEHSGTSVTMIGNSDGVLIPHQFIDTGKDIFAFLYHVGANYGRTVYKFRIPNKVRPDRTNEEPTPEEQSVIDQAIGALNDAVAQTAQDKADADASAQSASEYAEQAEISASTAQNYASASETYANTAEVHADRASASATASAQSASDAETARQATTSLVAEAQGYADASAQSASASANSASQAQGFAQSASASAQSASTSASDALTYANTASSKATEASTSAQTASTKATEASQSASQALSYKTDAESAKTASQTAQGLAESARDNAVSAKTDAESARDDAVQAKEDAESAVASISGALDDKAPVITDTTSGAIASFTDGADDLPLKSLVVDINPVQDLSHGDPSPENLCPISGWTEVDVYDDPLHGGNIEWNQLTQIIDADYANKWISSPVNYTTITVNDDTVVCTMSDDITQVNLINIGQKKRLVVGHKYLYSVKIKSDAWASSGNKLIIIFGGYWVRIFYPTDNVPTGKWFEASGIWTSTVADELQPTVRKYRDENNYPLEVKQYMIFDLTEMFGTGNEPSTVEEFKTLFPKDYYEYNEGKKTTVSAVNEKPCEHVTIQLGQTVYGGKLDVLSGELVIDRAMVDLGTLNYRYDSVRKWFVVRKSDAKGSKTDGVSANIISDTYTVYPRDTLADDLTIDNAIGLTQSSFLIARSLNYTNTSDFITAMNGHQLVYELATPITIQLTPNQVNSLLGVNNIWADSGDTEAVYRADTKLFIERLTAPDSADMVADANITSGQYFMVGNNLYKATANIANGGQIIVGTNATRVSLAQALNEINA